MRGSVLATLVAFGLGVTSVIGQTNEVPGWGAVGYYHIAIPPSGSIFLASISLAVTDETNRTLTGTFGTQLRSGVVPSLADRVYIRATNGNYDVFARKTSDGLYHSYTNFIGPATNPVIPFGSAVWLSSYPSAVSNHQVTLLGTITRWPTSGVTIVEGFQLLGNPMGWMWEDLRTTQLTNGTASSSLMASDHIFHQNRSNGAYSVYVLRPGNYWTAVTENASYLIPIDEGFWYKAINTFIWNGTDQGGNPL